MAALADTAGSFVDESIITDETRKYYCEYDESTMRQLQIVDENCVNLDLIEQLVTHIRRRLRGRRHSSLSTGDGRD